MSTRQSPSPRTNSCVNGPSRWPRHDAIPCGSPVNEGQMAPETTLKGVSGRLIPCWQFQHAEADTRERVILLESGLGGNVAVVDPGRAAELSRAYAPISESRPPQPRQVAHPRQQGVSGHSVIGTYLIARIIPGQESCPCIPVPDDRPRDRAQDDRTSVPSARGRGPRPPLPPVGPFPVAA